MLDLIIHEERCIQCGQCAVDCPAGVLDLSEGLPRPLAHREKACIECQHCLAVCPTAALSIFGLNPDHSSNLAPASPEMVKNLMQGRRSVRQYLPDAVSKAVMDRLMSAVMYAPTGKNAREVRFTLVDDPQVMEEVRARTYAGIRLAAKEERLPEKLSFFIKFANSWDKGGDPIFRHAPHMLIASESAESSSVEANLFIALSYFELMATSLGLGTLWCGFGTWAVRDIAPEIARLLGIPENHRLYVMMFGYPAVSYARTVQREIRGVHRVRLDK